MLGEDNIFRVLGLNTRTNYYELELYDAKLSKFISYKVVTDIIKK
jgi:hypothetical protein